ncbi:MAG: 5-formyltetrahydrofolate cyclo-ligase [Clostridiales Family XIII bacterium]|jgi:5-formyltetrahydrofolate cyclo-ligase|nr:5-formyltetrahydrofolate cyclo-ligase [Clostridiales Family XIII bacterium]
MKDKSIFRKEMLAKRAALESSARAEADRNILAALTSLPEYLAADMIFCYVSMADEPDTRALIEDALARGKRVCVPLCVSMGVMQAREISGQDDLTAGKYDIPEPKEGCPSVAPEEIGLIVVPCVCCDRDGYRLGYGGGFYDRWLEKRSAPAAVLCFEHMIVPSVPREQHDQRADILITDVGVRAF